VVRDAVELAEQLEALLDDPETAMMIGANGRDILHKNRGSLQQLLQLVGPLVEA
jgi:3-deoxy-D-manno-octulosonic-acid transferase